MEDEETIIEESPRERKRLNRWLIVALLAAVAAGVLLASSVWDYRWNSEDNTAGEEAVEAQKFNAEALCAAQSTYDGIRRELFRRSAAVRGSDQQAYARLSDFALLRVNGPVVRGIDEQLRSATCSGTAVLDLPPGVAAAGGRRSMSADIDYVVQPAADGTGYVIRLGNSDGIVVPLATLSRTGAPESAPLFPPEFEDRMSEEPFSPEGSEGMKGGGEGDFEAPAATNPSFDCSSARTRGEIAVCSDPGLAALDRQMAGQFNGALSDADGSQRRLLQRTRGRFLSYRDRCATSECVADTYRSRMREISDIMADRWRG